MNARPLPRRAPARPASPEQQRAYVAVLEAKAGIVEDPLQQSFFAALDDVRARSVVLSRAPSGRSLAEERGYAREDLMAVAALGYHYLMCGGYRLAQVLFEGLAALEPREPYFALALGLAHDRMEDVARALEQYERAAQLAPRDPRPDLNRAELLLAAGDRARAAQFLKSAENKAARAGDQALLEKARTILGFVTHKRSSR